MPITLGLIVVGMIVYFVLLRVRRGSEMVAEVIDMPSDVRTVARRLGYKRRTDVHPVDSIEDPQLAQIALAVAYGRLGAPPVPAMPAARIVKHGMAQDTEQARNMVVLGQWLVRTSGSARDAVPRLIRRLHTLGGGASATGLLALLQEMTPGDAPTARQTDARAEIRQALHVA